MLTLTAPIGQGVLRNIIRLQDNHIKYVPVVSVDTEKTGCNDCLVKKYMPDRCKTCEQRAFTTEYKKVYVNEAAKYGRKESLCKNAILTFIWLHFNSPDDKGFVRMVDSADAAKDIGCHQKTIVNNMKSLESAGYIACQQLDIPGYFDVVLLDYPTYFLKASNNGRGYINLSKEMFFEFVNQENLNALRLTIRTVLMSLESVRTNGFIAEKTYAEIKEDLPKYVTKNAIKKILHSSPFAKLFDIFAEKKYTISLKLKEQFDQSDIRQKLVATCKDAVNTCIRNINKTCAKKKKSQLKVTDAELKEIADIGAKYPSAFVVKAIEQVYFTYIAAEHQVKNIGALVRAFTKSNMMASASGVAA